MKEFIPGLGDRTARKRLDELFSRQTLGAVLFGAAASKVVEKVNAILVIVLAVFVFRIDVTPHMWVAAVVLLVAWSLEFILFIFIYVRWEQAVEKVNEAKEKASETAEKAKEKAEDVSEESNNEPE